MIAWRDAQAQSDVATQQRIYLIQKHQRGPIWYAVYGIENALQIEVEGVRDYHIYPVYENGLWRASIVASIRCGETLKINGLELDQNHCTYHPVTANNVT